MAWQHVQHQESLPDARARSHDLRNLRYVLGPVSLLCLDLAKHGRARKPSHTFAMTSCWPCISCRPKLCTQTGLRAFLAYVMLCDDRLRHLGGSAAFRQLGSGVGSASPAARLGRQDGPASKTRVAERDYDAGDPRRQTYHVVISSGAAHCVRRRMHSANPATARKAMEQHACFWLLPR